MSEMPSPEETEMAAGTRPLKDTAQTPESTAHPPPNTERAKDRRRAARARRPAPPAQQQPRVPLPRRSAPAPVPPSQSGWYLPWWSVALMVMIVGGIAFGLLFALSVINDPKVLGNQTPRIQVITSQPTLSQDFISGSSGEQELWPTSIPQAQPTPTLPLPTPIPSPSLPPGEFRIGVRVTVVGVDTVGLNVRSAPGTISTVLFVAAEGQEYAIVDGPQRADDLEWWKLQDPFDANRTGWAARNFLTVVTQ